MQKDLIFNYLARAISYAFHPLLMASFAVLIVFNSGHYLSVVNAELRNTIYSIYIILTFVLPALFIPVFYYLGIISKLEIDNKKERLLPLMTVAIMYALSWYFMSRVQMPPILLNIILSSLISVLITSAITIFWKISLHCAGMGGLLGFVFYLANQKDLSMLLIGFIVILASGVVASSRLYLKRHSQAQVYVGYALGFFVVYFSMLFL
ncbi:MAG: phosphatase PAP2 family protein [Bacteroidales bacterium]|nr:phosphatase PAP2 family protein [Bacteroidales bacterium]